MKKGDEQMKRATLVLATLALLLGGVGRARADFIANVTLDTTSLKNNPSQGAFSVEFLLADQGIAPQSLNNNTATISNFNLHGGSLTPGTITTFGSPSGNLSSTLAVKDSPRDAFIQDFTPGRSLSFTLDLTTNVTASEALVGGDRFLFQVLSNNATLVASGLQISIPGPNPTVSPFGGSLGNGVSVPAPAVSSVPEPSTLTLLGLGSLGLLGYGWRRRKRTAA
jgi:hypothetical protein